MCHAVVDLPRVLSMPVQVYLPRGMEAYLECPVDANPPPTLITWMKGDHSIDFERNSRLKQRKDGTLVFKTVISSDEGRYTCTPYSVLGAGRRSPVVQIFVRGR